MTPCAGHQYERQGSLSVIERCERRPSTIVQGRRQRNSGPEARIRHGRLCLQVTRSIAD
jgi:hypothetical protein